MASFIDLPEKEEFTETIKEIIDLRSRRKYYYQTNVNDNQLRQDALGLLRERMEALRNLSRDLQSSITIANNRTFVTEDSQYISGEVKPNAPVGDYEIEILNTGDKQLLISDPLSSKITLPPSRIVIGVVGEQIRFDFQGGSPQNFARSFNNFTQGYFTANWIRKSAQENFFVIQASQPGFAHRFRLQSDTGDVFSALKLFRPTPPIVKNFINTETLSQVGWDPYVGDMAGVVVPPGAVPPHLPETNVQQTPLSEPGIVTVNRVVDFLEVQNVFFKVDVLPPTPPEVLGGITNKSDKREMDGGSGEASEFDTVSQTAEQQSHPTREEIIKELQNKGEPILVLEYRAEDELRRATFTWKNVFNDRIWINDYKLKARLNKNVEFLSLKFINNSPYPYVLGKWFQSLYPTNQDKYLPLHEESSPKKIQFKFYSIKMERESPIVSDLIDGVTLNLLKPKEGPIRFSVEANSEGYHQQIIDFAMQYNYTMDLINVFLAPGKTDLSTEEIEPSLEDKIGVFSTEMNLRRLKDKMREIMEASYMIEEDQRPVYLQSLGIKLFISIAKPYHINSAKIELDGNLLQTKLEEYGDDAKHLFRSDRDGDFIPDDGFAYRMDRLLGDYLSPNSVLTSIQRGLKWENENLTKSLEAEQKRIDSYREKLESDFSKVKQAREQQKQLRGWLDSME